MWICLRFVPWIHGTTRPLPPSDRTFVSGALSPLTYVQTPCAEVVVVGRRAHDRRDADRGALARAERLVHAQRARNGYEFLQLLVLILLAVSKFTTCDDARRHCAAQRATLARGRARARACNVPQDAGISEWTDGSALARFGAMLARAGHERPRKGVADGGGPGRWDLR